MNRQISTAAKSKNKELERELVSVCNMDQCELKKYRVNQSRKLDMRFEKTQPHFDLIDMLESMKSIF